MMCLGTTMYDVSAQNHVEDMAAGYPFSKPVSYETFSFSVNILGRFYVSTMGGSEGGGN